MATTTSTAGPMSDPHNWYALAQEALTESWASTRRSDYRRRRPLPASPKPGRTSLPAEKPVPGWRQFLNQYRNYMQLILVAAGVLSLVIAQYNTAIVVLLITVLNAVAGIRQEGKAESAMNALKSMMKQTARVRRDGTESTYSLGRSGRGRCRPAGGGDNVPADGRLIAATSLQIDESALTGESVPASKDPATLSQD